MSLHKCFIVAHRKVDPDPSVAHSLLLLDVGPVSEDALRPLLHLLQSNDLVVQRAATTALLNLLQSNVLMMQKAATTARARLPDNGKAPGLYECTNSNIVF